MSLKRSKGKIAFGRETLGISVFLAQWIGLA